MSADPPGLTIASATRDGHGWTSGGADDKVTVVGDLLFRDLLPWRTFDICTSWSPDIAARELRNAIGEDSSLFGLFGRGGRAPFVGDVRENSEFRFKRRIGYRNSFLPTIRVVVEPSHRGGTRLRVTMRLHAVVMAFMAVWMTGATVGAMAGLATAFSGKPTGLVALALPLFGAGLMGLSFTLEARKAEKLLRTIYASAPALPAETGQAYR